MADSLEASSKIVTLANAVSVVRLLAIPVFLWLVINDRLLVAFILLVAAVLTDFVDGMIARRMNEITKLGQFLDPFADRLFIAATVIALAIQDVVPWWFVVAVMLRDALLGIGGLVMSRHGAGTLPVKWWGKVATFAMLFFASTSSHTMAQRVPCGRQALSRHSICNRLPKQTSANFSAAPPPRRRSSHGGGNMGRHGQEPVLPCRRTPYAWKKALVQSQD